MRTTYKEYGCTASITDKQDGTARLMKSRGLVSKIPPKGLGQRG